jgi:hypothetical protein
MRTIRKISVGNPEGKRLRVRTRNRQENIKMNLNMEAEGSLMCSKKHTIE